MVVELSGGRGNGGRWVGFKRVVIWFLIAGDRVADLISASNSFKPPHKRSIHTATSGTPFRETGTTHSFLDKAQKLGHLPLPVLESPPYFFMRKFDF